MRIILIIVSIMMMSFNSSNTIDLAKLRDNYYSAAINKSDAEEFYTIITKIKNIELAEIKGYTAMSFFLKANYLINPLKKWESFKEGKELLEKTITSNPNNVELIFLRLTIQTNAPKILGYNQNIEQDLEFLLKSIKSVEDSDLTTRIITFLNQFYLNN